MDIFDCVDALLLLIDAFVLGLAFALEVVPFGEVAFEAVFGVLVEKADSPAFLSPI